MTSVVWDSTGSGWLVRAGAASHIGNYREQNEDHVYLDPNQPFAIVLDGMGGHEAGELASTTGAEVIANVLRAGLTAGKTPHTLIERALSTANAALLALGEPSAAFKNCGATAAFAFLSGETVWVAWLGDAQAFRTSGEHIERLTWPHNLLRALIRAGTISETEASSTRGGRQLWKYLGTREAEPPFDSVSFVPRPGDRLLLATDGVWGVVPEDELRAECCAHPEPLRCAEELVSGALDKHSRDNCTCAVLAFEWTGSGPPPKSRQEVWEVGAHEQLRLVGHQSDVRKWWQFWK